MQVQHSAASLADIPVVTRLTCTHSTAQLVRSRDLLVIVLPLQKHSNQTVTKQVAPCIQCSLLVDAAGQSGSRTTERGDARKALSTPLGSAGPGATVCSEGKMGSIVMLRHFSVLRFC